MKKASKEEIQNLLELFKRLDIEVIENPNLNFKHIGLLDVYPKCLTEEEAVLLLGAEHNRSNEHKYTKYFQRFEQSIPGSIYITKRPIFCRRNKVKESVYKIENSHELMGIIIQITREECFYNLFVPEAETVVIGNFDLSWPVYSNSEYFKRFNEIAREVNLYIRPN